MTTDASLVGQTLGGRFRVLRSLAAGGMGWVYEARDELLQRPVALKVVRPELLRDPLMRARFHREARATAAVTHPALVPLHDLSVESDPPFLVMALLDGPNLDALIRREGRLPWTRAARLAVDALDALEALHRAGVVHRDLKPSNLVVVGEGRHERCHVIDLGVARLLQGDEREPRTATGALVGTPAYMAPEHLAGEPVGPLADVYAMGVVLFVSVAGFHPFGTARDAEGLAPGVAPSLRAVVPDVPEALSALVGKMLARTPSARPARAGDVADALRALLGAPSSHTDPTAPDVRVPVDLSQPGASERALAPTLPAARSRRGVAIAGVFVAAGALALAVIAPWRHEAPTSVRPTPSARPLPPPVTVDVPVPVAVPSAAPAHSAPSAHRTTTAPHAPDAPPSAPREPSPGAFDVRITGADARDLGSLSAEVARCFGARPSGARHLAGHYRVLLAADAAVLDAAPTGHDAEPDEDACVTRRLRAARWPATGARHAVYVVVHAR